MALASEGLVIAPLAALLALALELVPEACEADSPREALSAHLIALWRSCL